MERFEFSFGPTGGRRRQEVPFNILVLADLAGVTPLPLSPETYHLLVLAAQYGRMTEGAFDITVAPVAALWGLHGRPPAAPPAPDVALAALSGRGIENVILTNQSAFLVTRFTRVDLNGVAPGYAVDRVVITAREEGYRSFLVQIGNHARGLGWPRSGENWSVALPDPLLHHLVLARAEIPADLALAVTVQGWNAPRIAGRVAGPVLDPETGMPVSGVLLCAVWARTATRADALSTAFTVLGVEGTRRLLDRFPQCRVLLVENRRPPVFWATKDALPLLHWVTRRPAVVNPLQ